MRRWRYPALAFLTGGAVTVFEFAAPNLFRAYFGQTTYVWANVIGVILAALATGYAVGGRWADATSSTRPLFVVIAAGGLYALLVGILGPSVCAWLSGPEEYPQDAGLDAFIAQSLAATLLLFGPPLVALGMATPLLVKQAARDWPVGRASGLVFSIGTVGSLAGIFVTQYLLVPSVGVRATITGGAGLLVLLGALGLARPLAAALLLVPLGIAPVWASLPPQGSRLLVAIESPYQLVRVVDRPPDAAGKVVRWLAFDECMGSYHSMRVDESTGTTGAYYDAFVKVPDWVGVRGPQRLCIVGNAAGTMVSLLQRHHGPDRLEIDAVEIDPAVTEASRRAMGLVDHPKVHLFHEDGRTFLRRSAEGSYDAILLDAYARQVSVPAALSTREFFALAKRRLKPHGLLFVNLGALRPGGPLVRALADTMAAGFGSPVYRAPLHEQSNVLLVAGRGKVPPPPPDTPLLVPWSFALHRPGGTVLTDDYCPIESLTMRDLRLE